MAETPGFNHHKIVAKDTAGSSSSQDDSHLHIQPGQQSLALQNAVESSHVATPDHGESNIPSRFELFLLGPGEHKVDCEVDTRIPNSMMFTFHKEDHTLGNLLRSRLLTSPHVYFSAYRVPHPLVSDFELRIQTDGEITPKAALVQACRDIVQDLGKLGREFTKEWELRRMVTQEGQRGAGAGGDV
ncbi:MAG: hypothetical protein M1819_004380 [Sarea resinae]|nr:MAG: hypothetical protein M1819_004380 [Sarea resinae]